MRETPSKEHFKQLIRFYTQPRQSLRTHCTRGNESVKARSRQQLIIFKIIVWIQIVQLHCNKKPKRYL